MTFQKPVDPDGADRPYCFGILENVFPMGAEGLRASPERCVPCIYKTVCLQTAMQETEGLKVKSELVDRAYAAGMMGFIERWSRRKGLHRKVMARTGSNRPFKPPKCEKT